jgi:haloalkane dehalogenase
MKARIALVLLVAIGAAGSAAQEMKQRSNVRNQRYCEIFLANGSLSLITLDVYNTLGLNDCPNDQWKALKPDALKKEFHARQVVMNGPRYFMMDTIAEQSSGQVQSFDGLQARKVATFQMHPSGLGGRGKPPYTEQAINRDTDYTFDKGKPVYELVSPDGHTYVMQSYSVMVDPNLTQDQLVNLSSRLKLPKGWKYQSPVLDRDLVMKSGGTAYVIQDDLKNTYQRMQ